MSTLATISNSSWSMWGTLVNKKVGLLTYSKETKNFLLKKYFVVQYCTAVHMLRSFSMSLTSIDLRTAKHFRLFHLSLFTFHVLRSFSLIKFLNAIPSITLLSIKNFFRTNVHVILQKIPKSRSQTPWQNFHWGIVAKFFPREENFPQRKFCST